MTSAELEIARALIAADTQPGKGTRAAVDVLMPVWRAAGLEVLLDDAGGGDVNALASPPGALERGGDALLLVTHLDTVPSGPADRWTKTGGDPHRLTVEGDLAYGLGTADVKLDALAKAWAAARLKGVTLARPFHLLGTFGEEVGLRGTRRFIEGGPVRPRWVACGEPCELRIMSAHKGYAVVRVRLTDRAARAVETPETDVLTFEGKAAHSSTPALGVNAIDKALAYTLSVSARVLSVRGGTAANMIPGRCELVVAAPYEKGTPQPERAMPGGLVPRGKNLWRAAATAHALGELWRSLAAKLEPAEDARFAPAGAVASTTVIASGDDYVEATFDARLLPAHDPEALLAAFSTAAPAWTARLGDGALDLEIAIDRRYGGMSMPPDAPLVQAAGRAASALGLDPTPTAKPTSTEAGPFFRAGAEAIVFGAGRSTGNAHCANEHTVLSQLARAVDFYERLVREVCA